ncbi:MXAN_6230/SCO0854 family RING domain-containing protein [Streptomyces sp. NPDC090022]|uniref:MXAN_6230/SCO0854 family RING domain-containing protein n=1 Tax=Streptomyces sp. NPDC090022 TaxID=3365920 RepID=UPI003813F7BD
MLRRLGTVHVDRDTLATPATKPAGPALRRLENDLLQRGWTLSPDLYAALAALPAARLAPAGARLTALTDALLGADRVHVPLLRRFPFSTPRDTDRLYVDRVFAHLLQAPEQPCVLCGEQRTVFPVAPCAHLVCRLCWDGSDYAGCPLCHRRIDPADPFLRPASRAAAASRRIRKAPAGPLRLLRLGTDRAADAGAVLAGLLARRTPPAPQDLDDLAALLPWAPADLGWLPVDIPVRETKALVLGSLLRDARTRDAVRLLLAARLTTATDVLRLLAVYAGGDPGLDTLPRFTGLPRPLRRELLGALDVLPAPYLVEDLLRHPRAWKRAGEGLHPFEHHIRFPRAAMAFAVLRGSVPSPVTAFGAWLLDHASMHPDAVRVEGDRIRPATWAGRLEQALAEGDAGRAAELAGQRPGELVRRLDHLLRLHTGEALVPELERALRRALPGAGPGPLLSALGALRPRAEDRTATRRVFFPAGRVARAQVAPEERAPLPAALVGAVTALLEAEVVRRFEAAGAEPGERGRAYERAVLDAGLADLTVPFGARSTARALVAVPRGSTLTLPAGQVVRLFLHWTQPADRRTDLDLSVAFFDAGWNFTGLCDYTSLHHGDHGEAVHSGDLTSAPAPAGATEYVDLDLEALARRGDVYAVPVVFSYNNVPFDELPDAFAGFMALPAGAPRDAEYDPRTVRQRFDLAGASLVTLPMVVDLAARRARWTDVHLPPADGFQSVGSHGERLASVARDLWDHFGSGTRVTLWDLTVWRAAARCREVDVVRDGELLRYRRGAAEEAVAFAARIARLDVPEERLTCPDPEAAALQEAAGKRVFLARVHAGPAPEGASGTAYRLFEGDGDVPDSFVRAEAGDLLAELG